jgi:hypothetical protein
MAFSAVPPPSPVPLPAVRPIGGSPDPVFAFWNQRPELVNAVIRDATSKALQGIVQVTSFVDEPPEIIPVFVPLAGGRWGAPADLKFEWNDVVQDDDTPDDLSVSIVDNNEYKIYRGHEVTEDVTDAKTGQVVVHRYDYVCYIRTYRRERIDDHGGQLMPTRVTEIVHQYMDAKPWANAVEASMGSEIVEPWWSIAIDRNPKIE